MTKIIKTTMSRTDLTKDWIVEEGRSADFFELQKIIEDNGFGIIDGSPFAESFTVELVLSDEDCARYLALLEGGVQQEIDDYNAENSISMVVEVLNLDA